MDIEFQIFWLASLISPFLYQFGFFFFKFLNIYLISARNMVLKLTTLRSRVTHSCNWASQAPLITSYLLITYCVPGTVLDPWDVSKNKIHKHSCPHGADVLMEGDKNK